MRVIERATREELRKLSVPLGGSVLARTAVDLARRLDERPTDPAAVLLARELRMTMTTLIGRSEGGGLDEVERFLARIAAPDERDAAE
jgi:hypothetical protein